MIAHSIKHREIPNDEFYTPELLSHYLVGQVETRGGDTVLDAAYGGGSFYKNYPRYIVKKQTKDFYSWKENVDWIITNPPYSDLEKWLEHSCVVCKKGFAYLLGINNLTPRRIKICEDAGFGITSIHLCKVFKWFGISAFIIWEKNAKGIIKYDRVVWR